MNRNHDKAARLLEGAWDIHVHSAPDILPRRFSDIELARHYRDAGLAGCVIKSHVSDMAARAAIASEVVSGVTVRGGLALNLPAGGINPAAVEVSLKLGGRIVWMPTVDSVNHRSRTGASGGITIFDGQEGLKESVRDVLSLVAEYDAALATGHLSQREIEKLFAAALDMGVKNFLVTHPEFWITAMPVEMQEHLAKRGALFERCYYGSTLEEQRKTEFAQTVEWIRRVGADSTILASDLGQADNPPPAEGLRTMAEELLEAGIPESAIRRMFVDNPGRIAAG